MSMVTGPLLAFDTSSSTGSIAVGLDGEILAEASFNVRAGHSAALLPAIDAAMRSASLAPADLRGIVIGAGPGSFTGVRIAGASAKGMVHALEIPLFAYSSLLAVAARAWASAGPVCALVDARGRDVYAACYRFTSTERSDEAGIEELMAPSALSLDELIPRFRELDTGWLIGDGALRHRQELGDALGVPIAPIEFCMPSASALLWLVRNDPDLGYVPDPTTWEPDYLRASGAERIAAARARARA